MKKVGIYFLILITICFIMPTLLTKRGKEVTAHTENETTPEETNKEETNKEEKSNKEKSPIFDMSATYDYKKYGTIKLLHKSTSEVEEVPIDEYLCHVVSAEMPVDFELEALKAQAIVARTYTIYKIENKKHEEADICDDSKCCQAWISKEDRLARWEEGKQESNWAKIQEAVNKTSGLIITYENRPINAFFHSNSGGTTEIPVNVWGGTGYPYLQSVETSGEEAYTQYLSEVTITNEELLNKLKETHPEVTIDFADQDSIKVLEYTESKRVKTVKFGNIEIAGTEARTILGLKSTNFEITREDGTIKFTVKGYGHGVGMSQTGADSLAKQGENAGEIIHHFYTGVEIKEVNEL